MSGGGLSSVYGLTTPDEVQDFYDNWAAEYDAELDKNGYVTPKRCARVLAEHASAPWAPVADFGCGTGLGGLALRAHGFDCIDGFDFSEEMLARAETKGIYRSLAQIDLSVPITELNVNHYQNAAAIGVINPSVMPVTVLDDILALLPAGGCFVYSVNDYAAASGALETRLLELVEYAIADLMVKEHGEHLPGVDLASTVYLLKKR